MAAAMPPHAAAEDGRDQAVDYFQQYFSLTPRAHLSMKWS